MTRQPFCRFTAVLILAAIGWISQPAGADTSGAPAGLPFLHAQGDHVADPGNEPALLKGCNLGNWLIIEPWMLGGIIQATDQVEIFSTFRQRFGNERAERLINLYRDRYISDRDFQIIKSFGFNVVRLPFDYRLLQSDAPPYPIKPDAFTWLDKALAMAERAGVYVILDLHGAPGGQSMEMHTGQAGQNHLWDSATNQDRTVAVWRAIAERYKNRSVVAAFDLLNEPYGNQHQDLRGALSNLVPRLYAAIRGADPRHIIFAPGALNGGTDFYGNPHEKGWTNFGFTEHYYPGLFGDTPALQSHALVLNLRFPARRAEMQQLAVPYYVGEFNVVLEASGGPRLMRAYYDWFAKAGWVATMWSYKLLKTHGGAGLDAWYMATNADALPALNLQTSPYQDFEHFFSSLNTMNLAINTRLQKALTDPHPSPLPLTQYPLEETEAPATNSAIFTSGPLAGYSNVEIGGAKKSGVISDHHGTIHFWASGSDIFATSDCFNFISKPAHGNCELSARILHLRQSDQWAKAGVMARWGNAPDAAFAMVNTFPDGAIALCARSRAGAMTSEIKRFAGLPVDLKIAIKDGKAEGFYRTQGLNWAPLGSANVPREPDYCLGLAATSHAPELFTTADLQLNPSGKISSPSSHAGPQLLKNRSFETPAGWNSWGDSLQRQQNSSFAHTGSVAILCGGTSTNSGLWQDVPTIPGQRYTFSTWIKQPKISLGGAGTIELRLEATQDHHQITLNSSTFSLADLSAENQWLLLRVNATAINKSTRALIIYAPNKARGTTYLDDAKFFSPG